MKKGDVFEDNPSIFAVVMRYEHDLHRKWPGNLFIRFMSHDKNECIAFMDKLYDRVDSQWCDFESFDDQDLYTVCELCMDFAELRKKYQSK